MSKRDLEAEFTQELIKYRLPEWTVQHEFAESVSRKWRFDFAWPRYKVAVDIHGLIVIRNKDAAIVRGGHGTVPGMVNDMNKNNAATLLGWAYLVFCQNHMASDAAINMTMRMLAVRGWTP